MTKPISRPALIVAAAFAASVLSAPASAQDADAPVEPTEQAETGAEQADSVEEALAELEAKEEADPNYGLPRRQFYPPVNFDKAEKPEDIWVLDLSSGERVLIRLMPDWAPGHVSRIKELTQRGFYDGVIFHRVIEGFMAQGGDPTGTGQGGSELPDLKAEFNPMPHVRGTVSMARANEDDSANSQFFIVFYPRFNLDKRYTNFGRVIDNIAAVDAINRGEPPQNPTRILRASLASDNLPPLAAPAPQVEEEVTVDALNAPLQ